MANFCTIAKIRVRYFYEQWVTTKYTSTDDEVGETLTHDSLEEAVNYAQNYGESNNVEVIIPRRIE
jgi:hypothetical protein